MDERELNMDVVTPQDSQDTDESGSQPRSRHIPKEVASRLLEGARGRCCLCRVLIDPQRLDDDALFGSLEKHHIIHFSKGGGNTYDNLLLACANCHSQIHAHPEKYPADELRGKKLHWIGMKEVVPSELRMTDETQRSIEVTFSVESLNLQYSILAPDKTTVHKLGLFVKDNILKPLGEYDNNDDWMYADSVGLALRSAPQERLGGSFRLREVPLEPDDALTLTAMVHVYVTADIPEPREEEFQAMLEEWLYPYIKPDWCYDDLRDLALKLATMLHRRIQSHTRSVPPPISSLRDEIILELYRWRERRIPTRELVAKIAFRLSQEFWESSAGIEDLARGVFR